MAYNSLRFLYNTVQSNTIIITYLFIIYTNSSNNQVPILILMYILLYFNVVRTKILFFILEGNTFYVTGPK